MSVSGLKAELKFLASIFDKNQERFRIVSWKLEELHCQFLVLPPPPPAGQLAFATAAAHTSLQHHGILPIFITNMVCRL